MNSPNPIGSYSSTNVIDMIRHDYAGDFERLKHRPNDWLIRFVDVVWSMGRGDVWVARNPQSQSAKLSYGTLHRAVGWCLRQPDPEVASEALISLHMLTGGFVKIKRHVTTSVGPDDVEDARASEPYAWDEKVCAIYDYLNQVGCPDD